MRRPLSWSILHSIQRTKFILLASRHLLDRVISLLRFKLEPPKMAFSKLLQKPYIVYGYAEYFKFRQIHAKKTDR